ncbi:MAG: reverse transcriptase domain-containing protein, partial [Planctomycetota bacterium]|nr:reverse transcriptase domain-containing protein [Planctomycetota bacterium]
MVEAERRAAEEHIRFCLRIYKIQLESRRFFVHEHPSGASSWRMSEMVELMMTEGVEAVNVDMCQFGMKAVGKDGEGPVRKRTKIMSNSKEVLKRIERKCPNEGGTGERHEHVHLEDGRTKQAQVYPREFCRAVCEGIAAEKRIHALGLEAKPILSLSDMQQIAQKAGVRIGDGEDASKALHEETDENEWMVAVDDQSGEPLEPRMVKLARKEEIAYFKEREVYEKVKMNECWEATGKAPIGVRWVDINKGDTANPNYRSRLVAMEFKTDNKPEWYAATPPSECLKLILHKMAMSRKAKIMYADVSRAYFYAKASRPVYVTIPEEDREPGDENCCGKLKVSMYGTRDAALNWATEYGDTLKAAGFKQGVSSPCIFRHEK